MTILHAEDTTPKTDDEAIAAIGRLGYPALMAECAAGLFQCKRAMGAALLDAYTDTLLALVPDDILCRMAQSSAPAAKELDRRIEVLDQLRMGAP